LRQRKSRIVVGTKVTISSGARHATLEVYNTITM
jgi:hypothetical protein